MSSARPQLLRNATLTAAQVVVTAISMFVVYRYLLDRLGAARLGTWSIVMAASSVARITDLGFAGGLTRYVARYRSESDDEAVSEVVGTGVASLMLATALLLALAYPLLLHFIPRLIPSGASDALLLLPFSVASLGLLTVAGGYLSSIDGLLRTDLRNLIMMGSTLLYLVLVIGFVAQWGFVGLGWAQLCQSLTVLVAAIVVLRRQLPAGSLRLRWRLARFREMIGYNAHLQLGTLASLLGDPAAKMMLGRFGDLATVGYFEMATKLVSQFRSIVVNVNQVLVPVIAQFKAGQQDAVRALYERTHGLILFVSCAFFATLLAAVPLVSTVWLGTYQPTFILVCLVMLPTMALNTLAGAAFFSNLGTGDASSNSAVQTGMGLANLALGCTLGYALGGTGVILGHAVAITGGSLYLMLSFRRQHGLSLGTVLPPGQRAHVAITWLTAIACLAARPLLDGAAPHLWSVALVAALCLIMGVTLRHPIARAGWTHLRSRRGQR